MKFAEKLRMVRKDRGFSQEELGDAVGIAQQAIGAMERDEDPGGGKRPQSPYLCQAFRIARALSVSLDYLADEADESLPPPVPSESEREVGKIIATIGYEEAWKRLINAPAAVIVEKPGRAREKPGRGMKKPGG